MAFNGREECIRFLESKGVQFEDSHKNEIDTKSSYSTVAEASRVYDKIDIKGQI